MELPDETAVLLEEAAEIMNTTVSAIIARGAEREARHIVGSAALNEQLAEMGPLPKEAQAWAEELHRRHLRRSESLHQAKAS